MNLWTEFDNAQPTPNTTGRTARRLTERAILATLREWLLHDYTAAYCRSLAATRIFRRCYWIDGLGADGRAATSADEDGSAGRNGSERKKTERVPPTLQPVVSLSQLLAQESKPIALYALLLEAGKIKGAKARGTAPKPVVIPKGSGLIKASWSEAAPALLQEIEQVPAIFLLNPFGPVLFGYEDLALLYQRTVPTELCLLAPHKQLEAHLLAARSNSAQAAKLTSVLRTDRWKTLPVEEPARALQGLLDLFVASMQRYFPIPVQHIALPISVQRAVVEEVPYTLLFATRRQDSLMSMNDAVCLYRRRVYVRSRQGVLGEEWFVRQEELRLSGEAQKLYQYGLRQGRAQRVRRWPDLRQQLLLAHFGRFTLQEYDAVIRQLIANGEVRCERRARNVEDAHVPGNEDTLLWR